MKTTYIMNIIRNSVKGAAVLFGAALVMAGCQRDGLADGVDSGDGQIRYSVSVAGGTKGALINTTLEDQPLPAGNAFTVSAYKGSEALFTNKKATSKDGGVWTNDDPQYWPLSTKLAFFAYANTSAENIAMNAECTAQTLTYAVPADASAHQDILLGYGYGDGGNKGVAEIRFEHPLTAVRFKQGNMTGVTIKSITLSGLASGGKVAMTKGAIGKWTVGETEKYETVVTLSGGEDPLEVGETSKLIGEDSEGHYTGAFLLVPQKLAESDGGHPVNVTVILTTADGDVSVTADIDSGQWGKGKTNTYTLNYGSATGYALSVTEWDENAAGDIELDEKDYQYEFKVADSYMVFSNTTDAQTKTFQIESYRHLKGDDIIANREPVAYSAEYSIDGGDTWLSFDAEKKAGSSGIRGLSHTNNTGSIKMTGITLEAAGRGEGTEPIETGGRWKDDVISAFDWDLSRMQIGGEGDGTAVRNTANCYIVKHPGTYILPCVYGNSIQNGVDTDKGYKSTATGTKVMTNLINAQGNSITDAWVLKDMATAVHKPKAAIVWVDAKMNEELLIHDVRLVNESGADFNWSSDGGGQAYIRFATASKENMVQGNAVVALYDDCLDVNGAYDEGEALWSWHIWVTDADLSAENVGKIDDVSFMSRSLGWSDGLSAKVYSVDEQYKQIQIRLTQNGSALTQMVHVHQPDTYDYSKCGNNTFYQFGRKDPFPGSLNESTEDKPYYDENGTVIPELRTDNSAIFPNTPTTKANADKVVKNSISHPSTFATNSYYDGYYYNLWALNTTGAGTNNIVDKTVYDPCPYGYRMPNYTELHKVVQEGFVWQTNPSGYMFNGDRNLFFPANGVRNYKTGDIQGSTGSGASREGRWYCASYSTKTDGDGDTHLNAYRLYIHGGGTSGQQFGYKGNGYSVRPILEQ